MVALESELAALIIGELTDTVALEGLGATLRPSRHDPADTASWIALGETLPVFDVATAKPVGSMRPDPPDAAWAELEIGEILGEGGMGIVRLAIQNPLARDVAVKTVRSALGEARGLLVKEAITTGGLEHPNIVPIHALGRDAEGAPLLVMKRISGVSWLTLIHDANHPTWNLLGGDRLAFHLDTLMQVSNAVHFAHNKRVLHRDLKPENVMIGSYGEVYVLDWGVALSLDGPRPSGDGIVGTPVYMAPEMARGALHLLDERTDVYLLGAILHEVLTGRAPHSAPAGISSPSLLDVLKSACVSTPPVYGDPIPAPLGAIATRAMHRDPRERYASADDFRRAVADFLRHRGSMRVSDGAEQRLRALTELLAGSPSAEPIAAYKLFGECRFGFQHAIETFAENESARRGLEQAIASMAGYELGRRNATAARVLLAELREPSRELLARASALEAELGAEREELAKLRQLEREADVTLGSRARAVVAVLVALSFNLIVLGLTYFSWAGVVTLGRALGIALGFLGSVLVAAFIARDLINQNEANRRLAWALGIASLGMVVHRIAAIQLGAPIETVFVGDLVLLATSGGTVAATLDRRFSSVAIVLGLSVFVVALWPAWLSYTFPAAATLGALALALSWRR